MAVANAGSFTEKLNLTENGELIVSYSQLQTWDRCQYSWDLGYRQGWTSKSSKRYFDFGNLTHEFLALWYTFKKERLSEADFGVAYRELIQKKFAEDSGNPETLSEVVALMDKYFNDFVPFNDNAWNILEVEKHFEIPIQTPRGCWFILQGYVDLMIEIDGRLWIGEHKTVGNARGWTPVEVLMDAQTPTYAAALRALGYNPFGVAYNFLNSYNYKDMKNTPPDKLFKRDFSHRNDKEMDSILYEIGLAVDEIYAFIDGDGLMVPRKSLKKDCSFCQFQEPCLMGIKGLNSEAFLQINFKQKGERQTEESNKLPTNIILNF